MEMGKLIDKLAKVRERVRTLRSKLEALEDSYRELEDQVLHALTDAKLEKASGALATASISKTVVPTAKDWQEVEEFILKNKALDLLQRRLSDKAWRLRYEEGILVPGTEPYTVIKLNLRTK